MIIAIDGPTASGKGTLARRIGAHYGLPVLDTGALYRATALALLDAGGAASDAAAAARAARELDVRAIDETRIRADAVGQAASQIAAYPEVRAALMAAQRAFAAQPGGAVLDGRDIGTVICPGADVKLYVTASVAARAERRWRELSARGDPATLAQVQHDIEARDARDSGRAIAPLKPALDAHLLDTTSLSIDDAVAAARRIIDAARSSPPA